MVWTDLHATILGQAFEKVLGKAERWFHGLCALPDARCRGGPCH